MSIYARMLAQGASMGDIDRMDFTRYLRALAREIKQAEHRGGKRSSSVTSHSGRSFRRGTIDEIFK